MPNLYADNYKQDSYSPAPHLATVPSATDIHAFHIKGISRY